MSNAQSPIDAAPEAPVADAAGGPVDKPKKKKGSVETMFRVSFREQLELTALADSKANMMIQINGLIMSIILASSTIILDARPWLRVPSAALATTSLVSILFAVLAARPTLNKPASLTVEDVRSGRANILFFGNFGRLTEDEFVAGMREMVADPERVQLNMTRHIYGLGHVLFRKFRLLRVSYTVFLVGLLLSGGLFLVSQTAATLGGK